nr:gamma-glutamylcyclotransferase [Paraburkholderia phenazinium]
MRETLASRPTGPLWLFAYGSLIWNPLFRSTDSRRATLDGWHRRFCIRLVVGRGTAERPGRMLALEAGGSTAGIAYQFSESSLSAELSVVWMREMVGGVYEPRWERIRFEDGHEVEAIAFVANKAHPLYESASEIEHVAPIVEGASGTLGRNAEYATMLQDSLREHDMADPYVDTLVEALGNSQRLVTGDR